MTDSNAPRWDALPHSSKYATYDALALLLRAAADQSHEAIMADIQGRKDDAVWSRQLASQIGQLAGSIETEARANGILKSKERPL